MLSGIGHANLARQFLNVLDATELRLLSGSSQPRLSDQNSGVRLPSALWPLNADLMSQSGNYCRSPALLTDAQSQGTKVASTVARDGKIQGI